MHVALTQFNTGLAEGEGWVTRNPNNMHQKKAEIPALVKAERTWLKPPQEENMFDQARLLNDTQEMEIFAYSSQNHYMRQ